MGKKPMLHRKVSSPRLMTGPSPFPVYCVMAGDKYADYYVDRLFHMLGRHMPWPFELTCLTDRERSLHPGICQRVCIDASLRGVFSKMKLLDRSEVDHEAFLYLDVSAVVFKNLKPLLSFGLDSGKPVVAVADWKHGQLNSAVMVIRPGPLTQAMWEDYSSGRVHELRYGAQQAYMAAVLRDRGSMEEVAFFPPEWVPGYKFLRREHRRDPSSMERSLAQALIVKFHGEPKPHLLLHPRHALRMALQKPWCFRPDFGFMGDFLLEHWR